MKTLQAKETKKYMNMLGTSGEDFLAVISFDMQHNHVMPLETICDNDCLYHFPNKANAHNSYPRKINTQLNFTPLPFDEYHKAYKKVLAHINRGDSYLCNLCFETAVNLNEKLHHIFHGSKAKYKLWMKDKFVCFSPESFINTHQNTIYTYPMKGTIDANKKDAKNTLLTDPKETAEHYTITDLLRNDLSMVADNVEVNRYRYVEKITTSRNQLLQTSTEIKGMLTEGWQNHIGDIVFKLLPAGSITGAPKQKTMDIINKTENHKRGYYTGITCLFDGTDIDSFVMIRMITEQNRKHYYKSGGGITSLSNSENEYKEMIQKIYVPIH
jgi:para-aminobenzoate synthetase component 1